MKQFPSAQLVDQPSMLLCAGYVLCLHILILLPFCYSFLFWPFANISYPDIWLLNISPQLLIWKRKKNMSQNRERKTNMERELVYTWCLVIEIWLVQKIVYAFLVVHCFMFCIIFVSLGNSKWARGMTSRFCFQHHCRNCGDIFCDKCTQGRTALTADENAPVVRVCDRCTVWMNYHLHLLWLHFVHSQFCFWHFVLVPFSKLSLLGLKKKFHKILVPTFFWYFLNSTDFFSCGNSWLHVH